METRNDPRLENDADQRDLRLLLHQTRPDDPGACNEECLLTGAQLPQNLVLPRDQPPAPARYHQSGLERVPEVPLNQKLLRLGHRDKRPELEASCARVAREVLVSGKRHPITPLPQLQTHFMNHLARLGYVQRRLPLVPGQASRKLTRYAIVDPLLRFWFRFIAPNQIEAFCGTCFEQLCREALPNLYRAEGLTGKHAVGEFWSAETQIDVVGRRADGWTDLGERKWGQVRGLESISKEIADQAALYPLQGATLQKRLFVRHAPKAKPPPGLRVHDLESLYATAR